MRLLHLGDLHIGRSLGDYDLYEDQKYILDRILEIAEKNSVDAVLIAGDVYDKAIPSESATGLLDSFLSSLAEKKIRTFMISGNHDSDDRLNFGSALFRNSHIFISAICKGKLDKYVLEEDGTKVNVFQLPIVKASQVRYFYPDETIETYEDAVRVMIEHAGIDPEERNVLVAHQYVVGKGEDPILGGSEGAAAQNVGTVEKIGYGIFDMFDYVALGHIHSAQRVGRDEVRYSGSPLKYSLSEVNSAKSVPLITFEGNEPVKIELVPLTPMRDLRHIRGTMEELLDAGNIKAPEDFIYVTLTEEDVVNDAMGIFRQVYPNTVKIDYDNSHTRQIGQADISAIAEDRPFSALISDFYRLMYGCDITEEELAVMRAVAGEAGVPDETR